MTTLVDSNIPMYLVGADHRNKDAAHRRLDELITGGERLVTDAEVLQEILHRYTAIKRPEAIQPAFDAVLNIVDEVLPIEITDVDAAKAIVLGQYGLSARDAVHLAVMRRQGIERILSFDTDFDLFAGVQRLS